MTNAAIDLLRAELSSLQSTLKANADNLASANAFRDERAADILANTAVTESRLADVTAALAVLTAPIEEAPTVVVKRSSVRPSKAPVSLSSGPEQPVVDVDAEAGK